MKTRTNHWGHKNKITKKELTHLLVFALHNPLPLLCLPFNLSPASLSVCLYHGVQVRLSPTLLVYHGCQFVFQRLKVPHLWRLLCASLSQFVL